MTLTPNRKEQITRHLERLSKNSQGKALIDYLEMRIRLMDKVSAINDMDNFEKIALGKKMAVEELESVRNYLINLRDKRSSNKGSDYL
jgi:hypothetical protein